MSSFYPPAAGTSSAINANSAAGFSSTVSPPIPLAHYQPNGGAGLHSLALAYAPPASYASFASSSSLSSSASAYNAGREQPLPAAHSLSSSSLDQSTVYRGVFHQQEPTVFQPPQQQQQTSWQQTAYPQQSSMQHKKMELPTLSLLSQALPQTAFAHSPLPQMDIPAMPSHVERFTSFYSSAVPNVICKALRIGFQQVAQLRVDFAEEANKAKFRGVCYTEDGDSIQFITRVYRSASSAPAPYIVEFQRRCGDSVSFFRLYQKLVKACAHIHAAPFESSFPLPSMAMASGPVPMSALAYTAGSLPLPGTFAPMAMDIPTVQSLCNMVASDCVDTKREVSKCILQVSQNTDLFPALERSRSTPTASSGSTPAADSSSAMWFALVSLLSSTDGECARLGASILRNCLRRNQTANMLIEHLAADRTLVSHLVNKIASPIEDQSEEADALAQREIRRQVAAVLTVLAQKKSSALQPNELAILNAFNSQQSQL